MNTKISIILIVLSLLFATLVWPTMYRYERYGHLNIVVRINRITGDSDMLKADGWHRMDETIFNNQQFTPVGNDEK